MSQIYKIYVLNHSDDNANEVFAIKPHLDSFIAFKDEIYIRMPELRNQQFRIYYEDEEGDSVTIFNDLDFEIFQEQNIKKVFVVKTNGAAKGVQFQENQNAAPASATATIWTPLKTRPMSHVYFYDGICSGCDKSIFGHGYKCLECADFHLCIECEPKLHNPHLMGHISDPSDDEIYCRSRLNGQSSRHRRSESLCMKSKESEKEKKMRYYRKRRVSRTSRFRPSTVDDVLCGVRSVLKSIEHAPNEVNADNAPFDGTESNKRTNDVETAAVVSECPKASSSTSSTHATQTPNNPFRPTTVEDILVHRMHSGFKSFAAPTVPTDTNLPLPTVNTVDVIETATEEMKTAIEAVDIAGPVDVDPTNDQNDVTGLSLVSVDSDEDEFAENVAEKPNQQPQDGVIIDCSDDDEEELSHLVDRGIDAETQANEKDEHSGSTESDKSSPIREWTFIEPKEIAESAGAVATNGDTISKNINPPSQVQADESNASSKVNCAELCRQLSARIERDLAVPSTSAQAAAAAEAQSKIVADSADKTPLPTPMHPNPLVNESLEIMMAMGFSNEGGWLAQLLELVDGHILHTLELLQPQK